MNDHCDSKICSKKRCRVRGGCAHFIMGLSKANDAKIKRKERRKQFRQSVFDRDGNKCLKCKSTENLTIDHIVPKSRGGSHHIANLQTLCQKCNSKKGDKIV